MGWKTTIAVLWTWFPYKDSFIVVPLASLLVNIILCSLFSLGTHTYDPDLVNQAKRMSSLLSSASISILTLTFSLTVLSVQIAAQTYSPRLLDDFLKDPIPKLVIAVNIGAFSYCYTLNYFYGNEQEEISALAVQFLSVHMLIVVIAFVAFIHFFISGFRIERILTKAAESSLMAARSLTAEINTNSSKALRDDLPNVPDYAYKVAADSSGYVSRFRLEHILCEITELDARVRFHPQIGDFVTEGTLLAYVWSADTRSTDQKRLGDRVLDYYEISLEDTAKRVDDVVEEQLGILCNAGIVLSRNRSGDLDVTLGIQQIADIAMRALSPGINDPFTAIQAMDQLSVLLRILGLMELDIPSVKDSDGHLRASAPRRSFAFLLSMLDPIRHYGRGDLSVCRRGIRLFGDLCVILTRNRKLDLLPPAVAQMEQWLHKAQENFPETTPEGESLKALYEHLLEIIASSDHHVLRRGENVVIDTQEAETLYADSEEVKDDKNGLLAQAKGILNIGQETEDTAK